MLGSGFVANFYMEGIRDFYTLNYNEGTVSIAYKNEAGVLKFRYEEIIAKYKDTNDENLLKWVDGKTNIRTRYLKDLLYGNGYQ